MNEWFYEECESARVVRKKIQKKIFSLVVNKRASVTEAHAHAPVVWTSALILYYDAVDLRGSQKKKISSRAIRSGLSLFPYTRERGEYSRIREALIENDSTRLHFYYVFRRKTPIVAANETEMDPVRSTAGG